MAHFAKLGTNSKVISVHVLDNKDMLNADNVEDETVGQQRLQEIHGWPAQLWIQTSYNTRGNKHYDANNDLSSDQSKALRKNFAWIGGTYDATRDAFLPPHKYASWTLNEDTCVYDPPIPMPNDGKYYDWDESAYQADNTKGWVEIT